MTLYALVSPTNEISRYASDSEVNPQVGTKPGWRWLTVVDTSPSFDPALQVRTGPAFAFTSTTVERTWTVRDKTAGELAADADTRKEQQLDAFDALALKALFNHENRVRALESKAPITAAQFRAALKAML